MKKKILEQDTIEALKEAYNIIMILILLFVFLYFEVRNIETVNWLILAIIITSIMLAIIVPFLIEEFSQYAGLTFYTFGLIIIVINTFRYLQVRTLSNMLLFEFIVAILFLVNAFILRDKNWLLSHFKQAYQKERRVKAKKKGKPEKEPLKYLKAHAEYHKRMR